VEQILVIGSTMTRDGRFVDEAHVVAERRQR
jgi:hypothetical protein